MRQDGKLIGIAVALVLVVGPLLLGLTGLIRARCVPADAIPARAMPWNWKLTALLYALAFNLTFFIQELFLVLPRERNGFVLWWKKIEGREKFHWPRLLQISGYH